MKKELERGGGGEGVKSWGKIFMIMLMVEICIDARSQPWMLKVTRGAGGARKDEGKEQKLGHKY